MNTLYLVRHGENRANLTKEFSHRLIDYPLTPKGVLQAQQTAEFFRDKAIHAIYTSPLQRARQTAEIIAAPHGLAVTVLEGLREVNVGELERRPVSAEGWALYTRIMEAWFTGRPDVCFPEGEDFTSLRERMRTSLEEMVGSQEGRSIIAVGHGGIFTMTLRDLCPDVDPEWLRGQDNPNCSVSEIALSRRNGRLYGEVVSWGAHSHLHGEAADLVPSAPRAGELGEDREGQGTP